MEMELTQDLRNRGPGTRDEVMKRHLIADEMGLRLYLMNCHPHETAHTDNI